MNKPVAKSLTAGVPLLLGSLLLSGFVGSSQLKTLEQVKASDGPIVTGLVRRDDAVPTTGPWGEWRRYFKGETHGLTGMALLVVTLKPGEAPHPPHRHADEEFMILTEGTGTWFIDGREIPGRKGDTAYVAPWSMHGLKNSGDTPLTYYMIRWSNKGMRSPDEPPSGK